MDSTGWRCWDAEEELTGRGQRQQSAAGGSELKVIHEEPVIRAQLGERTQPRRTAHSLAGR